MSITSPVVQIAGFTKYTLGDEINSGYFGRVYVGVEVETGKEWACKVMEREKFSEKHRQNILDEVNILKRINHERIIRFHEFIQTETHDIIVMELMRGGDLFERLSNLPDDSFVEGDVRKLLLQIGDALKYLHGQGIAHRDLKIENLIFAEDDINSLKLGDFGLAKILNGSTVTPCGTSEYMAPEIVQGIAYNLGVDIWALGCLAYILLFGNFPFQVDEDQGETLHDLTEKINSGRFSFPDGTGNVVSNEAKDLIIQALQVDPTKRLTIQQFLEHPWMRNQPRSKIPLHIPKMLKSSIGLESLFTFGMYCTRENIEIWNQIQSQKAPVTLSGIASSALLEKRKKRKVQEVSDPKVTSGRTKKPNLSEKF